MIPPADDARRARDAARVLLLGIHARVLALEEQIRGGEAPSIVETTIVALSEDVSLALGRLYRSLDAGDPHAIARDILIPTLESVRAALRGRRRRAGESGTREALAHASHVATWSLDRWWP